MTLSKLFGHSGLSVYLKALMSLFFLLKTKINRNSYVEVTECNATNIVCQIVFSIAGSSIWEQE